MKFRITSLAILLVTITWFGCVKNNGTNPNSTVTNDIPTGHYVGALQLVHLNVKTQKTDTATAAVILQLNTDGSYTVDGDTSKIMVACHGTYTVGDGGDGTITFRDQTVTKTTNLNAPKKHLNGPFLFTHTPPSLRVYASSDTLYYNYTLTQN